jgi:molybdenum cofactor cytidylyltransferase
MVTNESWEKGIGGSICTGIEATADSEAAILLTCDQPFVDCEMVCRLIAARSESGLSIVASAYAKTLGVPVLFDREFYAELRSLEGDQGAKSIITRHPEHVTSVPFPAGEVDVDVPDDLQFLESHQLGSNPDR